MVFPKYIQTKMFMMLPMTSLVRVALLSRSPPLFLELLKDFLHPRFSLYIQWIN